MPPAQQRAIVVIDDNEEDIFIFKRLLEKVGVTNPILPFYDGAEAIKYFGRVALGGEEVPLACFVDINMPGYDGFDVLEAIRASEELDRIAVIVFSTSDDRRDIVKSANLGAQCYLVKHPKADVFSSLIDEAKKFLRRHGSTKTDLFDFPANLLPR